MVKQTGKIEKYEGSNVYFVGKDKPLFIPPEDIKAAMANFPAGKIVTYKTKDKQKGTLEGMAEPTEREMKSYLQDQKAAEAAGHGQKEFQPAGDLPRDPEAEKQRAAEALQQNLREKLDEKPGCFKAALCPKGCDGMKDPCQFKPKKPVVQEPPKQPPVSSTPINPPTGTGTAPQTTPAAMQGAPTTDSSIKELFEDLANTDPRVFEIIKHHEPELWDAFVKKIESIREDPTRQKSPAEDRRMPTDAELLDMTYNYDTYWKGKTLMDIAARHDIRRQVEFKNRLECVNTAITYCHLGAPGKSPKSEEVYAAAWDIFDTITQKINEE